MLDSSDEETVRAARLLFDEVQLAEKGKPIAFWIGAGASSWCGYPRWDDLADHFHSEFSRHETRYERNHGLDLLREHRFPELFQLCRDASGQRFYRLLAQHFHPREPTPVYSRLIRAILSAGPARILTTNIDELLEKNIPAAATISRADIERVTQLLPSGDSFVCKLHGSASDLRSTVFTQGDYNDLVADNGFTEMLGRLLASVSVIFLGYSLRDDYLLSMLQRNHELAVLFGDGPHFAIVPQGAAVLPPSVRMIRYVPEPHKDHRSSISVVEELGYLRALKKEGAPTQPADQPSQGIRSAHMLFDLFPPGTWQTAQTLNITREDGTHNQLIIGNGFTQGELPDDRSTAMHDLIVGLLCFDQVVAPIQSLARVHGLLGSDRFWTLVRDGTISFVSWVNQEGVIFPGAEAVSQGGLGSLSVFNADYTKKTVGNFIRRQLNPVPGKEEVAEALFTELEGKIREISIEEEGTIPALVRGLLLRPSIREILGISGGTPMDSLARWQVFPVLRLASVVKIGAACRVLQIGSAKLDFGTSRLAGPAFATAVGAEWTDDAASYVLCGQFSADVGLLALEDLSILDAVRAFRESTIGESLRHEVLSRLAANEGAEVSVAVNSALRAGIPWGVLQQARDRFVGMYISEPKSIKPSPAIWNDKRAEDAIALWRQVSRKILDDHCRQVGIQLYDPCPCGSGEKLKFCCAEALK